MIHTKKVFYPCNFCGERATRKGKFLENQHYCSWTCELKETWYSTSVTGTIAVILAISIFSLFGIRPDGESSLFVIGSLLLLGVGLFWIGMGVVGYLLVQRESSK